MRSQVLLRGTAVSELVAGGDDPKAHHGIVAHPAVHFHVFVIHGVLVLVVDLNTHRRLIRNKVPQKMRRSFQLCTNLPLHEDQARKDL